MYLFSKKVVDLLYHMCIKFGENNQFQWLKSVSEVVQSQQSPFNFFGNYFDQNDQLNRDFQINEIVRRKYTKNSL